MKVNHMAIAISLGVVAVANAMAAPIQQTLKFSTVVPVEDFTVTPTTPWPTTVTTIGYDKVNDTFSPYKNDVKITSLTQDVTAKLEKPANLIDGAKIIPLEVKLNNKILTQNAQTIHTKGSEKSYPLNIQPLNGKGYPAGDYAGDVVLIFDGV